MKKYILISTLFISIIICIGLIMYRTLRKEKENLYIAVASSFSGAFKEYGNEMLRGIQLYVDQTNATGGVNGAAIKLLLFDDQGTQQGAFKAAKSLVKNKRIRLVLGHYLSRTTARAAPVYEKFMIPSITSSATFDELTLKNEWLFRTVPPNSYQTAFLISYAKALLNVKKACVIYDTDLYGKSLLKTMTDKALELCIEVLQTFPVDTKDASTIDKQLNQIINKILCIPDSDMIVLATHANTSAKMIVQLRKNQCKQILFGTDSMASNKFTNALNLYTKKYSFTDIYSNDIYSTTWFHQDLAGKNFIEFSKDFENKYHLKPTLISTSAYDSTHVALTAFKSIDTTLSSRTIKKEFKQTLERYYDRYHCIKGLTGNIFFDAFGDMKKSLLVIKLMEKKIVPTFSQYIPIPFEKIADNLIEQGIRETIIVNDDQEYFSKTNVIFVNMDNISYNQIDRKEQTFHARFDIQFRFKENFRPETIQFPNAKHPILLKNPKKQIQHPDNSQTIVYTVDGVFQHDFNYKKYPFDIQTLSILLRDTEQGIDKLIFTANDPGNTHFALDSEKYTPLYRYSYVDESEAISETGKKELFSHFHADLKIKTKLAGKTLIMLIPLCVLTFLVYIGYFIPCKQMHVSMIINVFLLIVNGYSQLYFRLPLHCIMFSEYLYIAMYGVIGFTIFYQAILLRLYVMQLLRTVLALRITGIVFFPVIIVSVLYFF